ncbi:hypothetical protein BJX63DRAFT_87536 [Aspergillus granulosus]|uniref:Mid2 domain-containing protein n=1 Tax=Aspergillus granulosus TaxID=176169 RepID=A0ABR4GVJ0_9EURO
MRVTSLSFFLYSLSLVAVVAGQSTQVTDSITDLLPTSTGSSADPEPTESSTTETTETSTSTDDEPTTTTTTTTTTSSDDEPSTTESSTTTTEPTTTTSTRDPTTTTTTSTRSDSDDDNEPTPTPTVTTITTTQTIDGTPIPTTYTTTNTDSGLSSNQKNIIIGVVVGVGGAILIGAIGVVAWRIRARRRNAQDDDVTDLMSGTAVGSGVREKAPSPATGGTPFRSTLDQYHNPGPVNAASNF